LPIAPAIDQIGLFMERGIDQMRRAFYLLGDRRALRGIGEIDRNEARAIKLARLAPRQRDHFCVADRAESTKRRAADEACRAGDDHLFCHGQNLPFLVVWTNLALPLAASKRLDPEAFATAQSGAPLIPRRPLVILRGDPTTSAHKQCRSAKDK